MSKPTCRALLDWIAMVHAKRCVCEESSPCDVRRLASRVDLVLALHKQERSRAGWANPPGAEGFLIFCSHCRRNWPCPTVRLLNGEEP